MKKFFPIIFFVIIYLILSRSGIFGGKKSEEAIPQYTRSVSLTYGERGADNSWPDVGDRNIAIADNITAKNYYVVVDGSGSMAESECSAGRRKIEVAKEAIAKFVSTLPSDTNLGVYVFDAFADQERIAIGGNNRNTVLSTISKIDAGGGTPLARSIARGVYSLSEQARKQLGYGEYHLIVVTDGQANSTMNTEKEVESLLLNTPIILHTIGFCIGTKHSLNNPGRTVYKPADSPKALEDGLQEVLAEAPTFDAGSFTELK